uniref:Anaphase-promoting complex subunit 4 WD40 domain-containing protein n=1 Tax=Aegilops tauschii subsp. strangulata TaxID=200361 RepID=A0A453ECN6_AEGTS
CCVASSARPGVVASSGEDGCLCWFDLRTKDVLLTIEAANKPISSICFKSGNEDHVYISAGNEILSFDIRMGSQSKPLETYNYNRDEINQRLLSVLKAILLLQMTVGMLRLSIPLKSACTKD